MRRLAAWRAWGVSGGSLGLSRERALVASFAVALVLLRSGAFVIGRAPQFDSDQAIVGLMAKHLSEFRALPVFFYGQPFMLAVEAWLAAPLFLVAGPSVTALKLPLLGVHVAVTLLLLRMLERELGLRPLLALVPTLFFVLAPVGSTGLLLQANGGNVEPLLYVLLLWLLRRRPLAFGAVLGFGYLNREFTAYGLGALLLIEAVSGALVRRDFLRDKALALVSLVAVFQAVNALASVSNPLGPGTTFASLTRQSGFEELLGRSCWSWSDTPVWLATMFTTHLDTLFTGGSGWLWLLLGGAAVAAVLRLVPALLAAGPAGRRALQLPAYLIVIGLLAAVVPAVSRCGAMYERYFLLALFGMVGVAALYLKVERRSGLRAACIAVVLACWRPPTPPGMYDTPWITTRNRPVRALCWRITWCPTARASPRVTTGSPTT